VGYPRYSDELIGAVINHEAKHRRLAEVWHGHNYTKALFAFGGHYSSGGCERKKKALIGKFKRAWNQFRQAQANHGGDEWRGYVLFTPIFASDEDWWSGPDPVSLIQPLEDPLGRW